MPSRVVSSLVGDAPPSVVEQAPARKSPVKALLEGVVNIHIHNGPAEPEVAAAPAPEPVPEAEEIRPPPGAAKNYSFRVKRDAEGRITEILATRLS